MLYTINNKELKGEPGQRICGLDLIRVVAIFFVIAGHFFVINTSYRSVPFTGMSMFLQGMMHSVFTVGVPLFMMLTGYLNIHKIAETCGFDDQAYFCRVFKKETGVPPNEFQPKLLNDNKIYHTNAKLEP